MKPSPQPAAQQLATEVRYAAPGRVACVGAGYWGKNLVRVFHELGALAQVCEPDTARRQALARDYPGVDLRADFDAALRDATIDAVAIASPAETHGRMVRQALLAGKDVFVEKPLCLSLDEGRELVALAAERGRILMVGHLLWYHPAILRLKELVDAGELGRIQYIYSTRVNLGRIRREENILWSFAPHDISVILGLVGEAPDGVEAQGGNYLHKNIADVTVSLLSFPSGVKAHLFVSWLHPYKEQKLVVVGDRKMAVFDDVEPDRKLVVYPHSIDWRNHVPVPLRAESQAVEFPRVEPLKAECLHFLERLRDRARPRTDGDEALRVLSVLQACQDRLTRADGPARTAAPAAANYFLHPTSEVEPGCTIGDGTKIWNFSRVLRDSTLGRNCRVGQNVVIGPNVRIGNAAKIQNNVSVYDGVTLEDDVFCGPSMVFTNVSVPRSHHPRMDQLQPTLVRRGATLGANCTIVCGVTIGRYAFVGAGAVVTADVPDHALVVGNPARLAGWRCECGHPVDFDAAGIQGRCRDCGRGYTKAGTDVRPR